MIKPLLLLLLTIVSATTTLAQNRYALIDKTLKSPIIYTDSVTVEQVDKGYFPIENKSVDSLIANLRYLRDLLSERKRSKIESFQLRSSNTVITTKRVPFAYGDRFVATATSKSGEVSAELTLLNVKRKNKENRRWLIKILSYLESNQTFWKEPAEITPKLYEVIVVSDK